MVFKGLNGTAEEGAEKIFRPANNEPQALKRVSHLNSLAARVNSCPSRSYLRIDHFSATCEVVPFPKSGLSASSRQGLGNAGKMPRYFALCALLELEHYDFWV
jgi:hypothetical protein